MDRIPKEITVDGYLYRMVEDQQLDEVAMIGFDALKDSLPKQIYIFKLVRVDDSFTEGSYTFWYEFNRNHRVKFDYNYRAGTLSYVVDRERPHFPEHVRSIHDLIDEVHDALEDVAEDYGYNESADMNEAKLWHEFNKTDWYGYAGAVRLPDGGEPLINTIDIPVEIIFTGNERGGYAIEMDYLDEPGDHDPSIEDDYSWYLDLGRMDKEDAIDEFEDLIRSAKGIKDLKSAQRVAKRFRMESI